MAKSIIFGITKLYEDYKEGGCHSNTFNLHNLSRSPFGFTTACTDPDHGFNCSYIGVIAMAMPRAPWKTSSSSCSKVNSGPYCTIFMKGCWISTNSKSNFMYEAGRIWFILGIQEDISSFSSLIPSIVFISSLSTVGRSVMSMQKPSGLIKWFPCVIFRLGTWVMDVYVSSNIHASLAFKGGFYHSSLKHSLLSLILLSFSRL